MNFASVYAQQLLSNILRFVIFILQERVSQIVPAIDGAGLLQYLTVLCNLNIAGAGFSTCSILVRAGLLDLLTDFVIFLLQERVSQHVPTLV
jgi:hypothetical protein